MYFAKYLYHVVVDFLRNGRYVSERSLGSFVSHCLKRGMVYGL